MSRPVVGYVLKRFPRLSETFILRELLELERMGVELCVFSLYRVNEPTRHADYARLRAPVVYLEDEVPRAADAEATSAERRESKTERAARKLLPFVQAAGVTHLHAHFATGAAETARALGRELRIPFSVTAHAKDIFHESVSTEGLRALMADAAFMVTVSDYNVAHLQAVASTTVSTPIHRIYNGIDTTLHPLHDDRGRHPEHVLGVGRLVEKKGFETLVDAMAILRGTRPNARATIVGTGECADALRERIARHDLADAVTLAGAQPQAQVLDLMRQTTALAVPCVVGRDGNRDGLPTVIIEAMALGLPVVSTPVTGIPEIVRHGTTGLLVPEHAPLALAQALSAVMRDAELRATLRAQARALVVGAFDTRRNVQRLADLFTHHPTRATGAVAESHLTPVAVPVPVSIAGGAR